VNSCKQELLRYMLQNFAVSLSCVLQGNGGTPLSVVRYIWHVFCCKLQEEDDIEKKL